jgi:hypothetical protein
MAGSTRRATIELRGNVAGDGDQFRGAIETVNVLPGRLPQPVEQSFRSRSSTLVCGGRPCCNSAAAT